MAGRLKSTKNLDHLIWFSVKRVGSVGRTWKRAIMLGWRRRISTRASCARRSSTTMRLVVLIATFSVGKCFCKNKETKTLVQRYQNTALVQEVREDKERERDR